MYSEVVDKSTGFIKDLGTSREQRTLTIESATTTDLEQMARVYTTGYAEEHWGQKFTQDTAIDIIKYYLIRDNCLVFRHGEEVVGFVLSMIAEKEEAVNALINASSGVLTMSVNDSTGSYSPSEKDAECLLDKEGPLMKSYMDVLPEGEPISFIGELVVDRAFRHDLYPLAFARLWTAFAENTRLSGASTAIAMTLNKGPLFRILTRAEKYGICTFLEESISLYDEAGEETEMKYVFLTVNLRNSTLRAMENFNKLYMPLLRLTETLQKAAGGLTSALQG